MCRNFRIGILMLLCLVLGALTFGCAGGGLPRTAQINQSGQTGEGATQSMQSPMLGFVYTTNGGEVRAINGVAGASTQGSPVALPEGVTGINFAPGQNSAIVVRGGGAAVGVISFLGTTAGPLVPIAGGISQPEIIAFSPNGAGAVLYSASEDRLQVVAGLPDTPQLIRNVGSGELPDPARVLALADDGVTLLEGTVHSAVYLLAGSGPQLLESVSDLGGILFNPKSNNALIFDRNGGTLSLLQSVSTSSTSRVLASGLTGLDGSIALETNGRRAVITSTNASHLWEIDLQSLQAQNLKLSAAPTMLQPLRANGDYLLSWQPGQLAWIVDTNQEKGAVYLVPAAAPAQSSLAR